jgi:multiple sugar transport system permease protein
MHTGPTFWSRLLTPSGILPHLLLAPAILSLLIFVIVPVIYSIYLSFTDANLLRFSEAEYIGLENYQRLLERGRFWESLSNTLVYTIGTTALSFAMGLFTALILNEPFRGRGLARTLISIPWATPWLVVTTIWYVMFNPQIGPINEILKGLGLIQVGVPWLYQTNTAMIAIIIVTSWRLFPSATLIILAGLQSISPELYEAAKVDGAGHWARFRYITLPSLMSVNLVMIVLLTITAFKLITVALTLTQGGPGTATSVLSVYTYQEAFESNRLGRASALASLSVLVSGLLVIIYFVLIGRQDRESESP